MRAVQDAVAHVTTTVTTLWLVACLYSLFNIVLFVNLYTKLVRMLNSDLVRTRCVCTSHPVHHPLRSSSVLDTPVQLVAAAGPGRGD